MSVEGLQRWAPLLVIATMLVAVVAGALSPAAETRRRETWVPLASRIPLVTLALALAIVACLLLQLRFPDLLNHMRRDADAVRHGELWRILTALFFQDGWIVGGVFNIVCLLAVGAVAERRLGRRRWLLLYFGGGLLVELLALLLQPVGAGNSIANFSLAGALLFGATHRGRAPVRVLGVVGFVPALLLLSLADVHGAATFVGAGLRALLFRPGQREPATTSI